jgi:hypothetical protein
MTTYKYVAKINGFEAILYTSPCLSSHRSITLIFNNKHENHTVESEDEALVWAVQKIGDKTNQIAVFKRAAII